jgi:hypothetical protein
MKQSTSHVIRHLALGVTTAMFADAMLDVRDQSSARVLAGSTEFDFTCTSRRQSCKFMQSNELDNCSYENKKNYE